VTEPVVSAAAASAVPVWYPAPRDADVVPGLLAEFEAAFGRAADGVWSAPGRVNLIGEHVDYNGGLCLPLALPHRTFIAVRLRDDDVVRVRSLQEPQVWEGSLGSIAPGAVQGWAGYAVGVPWALGRSGFGSPGFDAVVDGRVPLGAGLSSSAALEAAFAVALDELGRLGLASSETGRKRLAEACVSAERLIAGAPTGGLDQAAVLRSRPGQALLVDCRDFSVEHVRLPLDELGLEFLVIDTRARHALVDGQYGSVREGCEEAAKLLGVELLGEIGPSESDEALARLAPHGEELVRLTRHVVTEVGRVRQAVSALRTGTQGSMRDLGGLFDASHVSLRDDFRVSCDELDVACSAAVSAGAWGARMTGGGFGGSAVALVPTSAVRAVAEAVADTFAGRGFAAPRFLEATGAEVAGRSS
jgi:galactokinase